MNRRGSLLLLLGGLLLAACQPWYRDAYRRGQRAQRAPTSAALLERAERSQLAGHPERAIEQARTALARDPHDGRAYLVLARCLATAGRHAEARFIARRGLDTTGLADLRPLLLKEYLADDLTAAALDLIDQPADLQRAAEAGVPGAAELARAEQLSATDPDRAMAQYEKWLDDYGVPDHPLLRAARERIVAAMWADDQIHLLLADLLRVADRETAAGHLEYALALYAHLLLRVPGDQFSRHLPRYLYAASAARDAAIDPRARELARHGDAELKAGHLGPAIHAYRRALVLAPWWRAARHNLALLFDLAGRTDESRFHRYWLARLEAAPTWEPGAARADRRSAREVARAGWPADVKAIAQVDLAAARTTPLLAGVLARLGEQNGPAELLPQLEARCGIDASTAVDQLVVAGDDRGSTAVWAQLDQLGEPEVSDCITRIASGRGYQLTVSRRARDGGLAVEYSAAGQPDKLYASWHDRVIAFALPPTDRATLDRMTGGDGALAADPRLDAGLAQLDPAALAWLMLLGPESVDGGTADRIVFQLLAAGDRYRVDMRTVMASPAEAQAFAAAQQQQLQAAAAAAPPALAEAVRGARISANGAVVIARATLTADQLLALFDLLLA